MAETTSTPPHTLSIKVGEVQTDILMSFGRLNELAGLVSDINLLPTIDFDLATRTAVLAICLAPRDERGRRTDQDWCIPPELSVEAASAVLDWAKDHLMDFFIGRLEQHLVALKQNDARLTGLGASLSSSQP